MLKAVLLIFVKYPQAGHVKTRLAKTIGKEKAAVLYRLFAENILKNTKDATYSRIIFYSPPEKRKETEEWLGRDIDLRPQEGDNLGEKLSHAFEFIFKKGAKRAVAIGTDSPLLDKKFILEAFEELENKQCVIGPAADGGYYLLGLSSFQKKIFRNIDWGTDRVLAQTVNILHDSGIKFSLLKEYYDIDNIEDLKKLTQEMNLSPG